MNENLALLVARKELLLARSRLHRLELRHQVRELRESVLRPLATLSHLASAAGAALTLIQAVRALLRAGSPPSAP